MPLTNVAEDFRKALANENITYAKYREDVRNELTMQRLREREVDSKIMVTDAEVNNYLATVASQAGGEREYLLSHIYVTVPEQASAEQIDDWRQQIELAKAETRDAKADAEREISRVRRDIPASLKFPYRFELFAGVERHSFDVGLRAFRACQEEQAVDHPRQLGILLQT